MRGDREELRDSSFPLPGQLVAPDSKSEAGYEPVYENLAVDLAGRLGADCWNLKQVTHQLWRASTKLPERPVGTAVQPLARYRR